MKTIRRSRRAFTLPEMLIAVTIFLGISLFVASMTLTMARQAKESISQLPADAQAYRAMEYIRRRLLPADALSTTITDEERTILFISPASGSRSSLTFDENSRKLLFTADTSGENAPEVWGRNIEGTFSRVTGSTRRIRIDIRSRAVNYSNDDLVLRYSDEVALRN